MRRLRLSILYVVFFALALCRIAVGQEKELTPLEIFDRALTSFNSQRAALRDWQYHQTLTTHQLDNTGKVTARGTWQSIVRPGDPRPLEYTAERMEGKISFFKSESSSSSATSSSAPPSATKSKSREEEKNQAESAVEAVRKYNLR